MQKKEGERCEKMTQVLPLHAAASQQWWNLCTKKIRAPPFPHTHILFSYYSPSLLFLLSVPESVNLSFSSSLSFITRPVTHTHAATLNISFSLLCPLSISCPPLIHSPVSAPSYFAVYFSPPLLHLPPPLPGSPSASLPITHQHPD